tara:strand:- start:166 stop:354 length:189 start_codon:yes stop_codon:yes gene_type:complete
MKIILFLIILFSQISLSEEVILESFPTSKVESYSDSTNHSILSDNERLDDVVKITKDNGKYF